MALPEELDAVLRERDGDERDQGQEGHGGDQAVDGVDLERDGYATALGGCFGTVHGGSFAGATMGPSYPV